MKAPGMRAVIDVGTNSVKLLVARVEGHSVSPLYEKSSQTRLGRGFYETHILQAEAISETAAAVAKFARKAAEWNPERIRVIATSAARDAENKEELLSAIYDTSGLPVEIISGDQEADWVYHGVTSHPQFSQHPLLIVDLGGGSSELIVGADGEPLFRKSYLLGTVRLLERLRPQDPPLGEDWERCCAHLDAMIAKQILPDVGPVMSGLRHKTIELVGTGGTSTILARLALELSTFERERIDGATVTLEEVSAWRKRLWSMSLVERQSIPGLPANRADIILMGAAIFEELMRQLGFGQVRVSARGLRHAAVI